MSTTSTISTTSANPSKVSGAFAAYRLETWDEIFAFADQNGLQDATVESIVTAWRASQRALLH